MATVQIVVCDVCESKDAKVEPVRITMGGQTTKADLCAECITPLEELLTKVQSDPRIGSRVGRKPGSTNNKKKATARKVTPVNELEKAKG